MHFSFSWVENFSRLRLLRMASNQSVHSAQSAETDILLTTLNAKYIHAAFGLRYLHANMLDLQTRTKIVEFDINQKLNDIAESLLSYRSKIIGFSVYIWNVEPISKIIGILKKIRPELIIVVGGPEVSFEIDAQKWIEKVDHVITGEADQSFYQLCIQLIHPDQKYGNIPKVIVSQLPDVKKLILPYTLYSNQDLHHRIVYVEASRGCPFTCEFCLSSLDVPVRAFPLDPLLKELDQLFQRGLRHFKFVDRTFNLNIQTGKSILNFFLDRYESGLFLHFEMIPDRLPEPLREIISKFPEGSIQFEIGIQTFNPDVSNHISRRQNVAKLSDNLIFLRTQTGVHLHVDLIAGLPGETLESFGKGFDQLVKLNPHEIQIGILKRLRGTPIVRHDAEFEMVYGDSAPYEILKTKDISFEELQRVKRFARYWDLVGNSGNFVQSVKLFWEESGAPFDSFMAFSDWLYQSSGRRHGISLTNLVEYVFEFLTQSASINPNKAAEILLVDYQRSGRSDQPKCLRPYLESKDQEILLSMDSNTQKTKACLKGKNPRHKRQQMHQGN